MANFIINGGNMLSGTVYPMPNKNSVVAIIPAVILLDEPAILSNVPKSSSVRALLRIFRSLGGKVSYLKSGELRLDPRNISNHIIPKELAKLERSSNMFLAPLLARLGKAELGGVGGCKLGQRPVDTLLQGLLSMGASLDPENIFNLTTDGLKGGHEIWQLEASVTGTESLIMAAVKAEGTTVVYNAASEPHVQDLCNFLLASGAQIEGVGSNRLVISGVGSLNGCSWRILPDHIDIGGLIAAAAMNKGEIRIKDAIPTHMVQVMDFFRKLSVETVVEGEDIIVPANQEIHCKPNLSGDMDIIRAQPWPTGFPVDLIPQLLVTAASGSGNIRIMNSMYESGLTFVDELIRLRGKMVLADPSRVITFGPSPWKGGVVSAPPVLQCAHAVALVGFAAKGTTKILNADIISRRYPEFITTFRSLGGDISEE